MPYASAAGRVLPRNRLQATSPRQREQYWLAQSSPAWGKGGAQVSRHSAGFRTPSKVGSLPWEGLLASSQELFRSQRMRLLIRCLKYTACPLKQPLWRRTGGQPTSRQWVGQDLSFGPGLTFFPSPGSPNSAAWNYAADFGSTARRSPIWATAHYPEEGECFPLSPGGVAAPLSPGYVWTDGAAFLFQPGFGQCCE